jgi:hypothetical protein
LPLAGFARFFDLTAVLAICPEIVPCSASTRVIHSG